MLFLLHPETFGFARVLLGLLSKALQCFSHSWWVLSYAGGAELWAQSCPLAGVNLLGEVKQSSWRCRHLQLLSYLGASQKDAVCRPVQLNKEGQRFFWKAELIPIKHLSVST